LRIDIVVICRVVRGVVSKPVSILRQAMDVLIAAVRVGFKQPEVIPHALAFHAHALP
jgi:hypothetical protein